MELYATDRIDDAVSLMRSFLLPVSGWQWLKLTVVLAFVGTASGGGSSLSLVTNAPSAIPTLASAPVPAGSLPAPTLDTVPGELLVIAGAFVAVAFVCWLVVGYVGAVMEFVFLAALRDREVGIRQAFGRYYGRGQRLFAFRIVLGAVATLGVAGLVGGLLWPEVSSLLAGETVTADTGLAGRVATAVALAVPLLAVVAFVHGTTTEFVAPIMLQEETGVIAGWQRFWGVLRADLTQYAAYFAIAFVLRILTTAAAGIAVSVLIVAVTIPFAIVAVVVVTGTAAAGSVSPVVVVPAVLLGVAYLATVAVCSAVVFVPVRTFHRYYGLLVLGDTESSLDLLADLRSDLRPSFATD